MKNSKANARFPAQLQHSNLILDRWKHIQKYTLSANATLVLQEDSARKVWDLHKGRYTRGSLLLKHAPETRSRVSTPTKDTRKYTRRTRRGSWMMKQPDWGMETMKASSQWVVDEKNKPIWLANWRNVMSRQANFSTHQGACSWSRLVQQICPWSLLPHIKSVWYEGAKLGSKCFVAQHIFSLEIVGAD